MLIFDWFSVGLKNIYVVPFVSSFTMFKILIIYYVILHQVSAVSDQIGMEDMGVHPGELDDDEGGGLVSLCFVATLKSVVTQFSSCYCAFMSS